MKEHFLKISAAPTLLILLFLAGCGGGGGGGAQASVGGEAHTPTDSNLQPTSATVTWLPPTNNIDDSAFTDLVGYKFYIGSEPGRYHIVRMLKDPGLTEYLIEDIPAGTYYVAMTAVNSQNIESPLSNVVVKVVGN